MTLFLYMIEEIYFDNLDLLDEWSCMAPKLKELLSKTRKMPLRVRLYIHSIKFLNLLILLF